MKVKKILLSFVSVLAVVCLASCGSKGFDKSNFDSFKFYEDFTLDELPGYLDYTATYTKLDNFKETTYLLECEETKLAYNELDDNKVQVINFMTNEVKFTLDKQTDTFGGFKDWNNTELISYSNSYPFFAIHQGNKTLVYSNTGEKLGEFDTLEEFALESKIYKFVSLSESYVYYQYVAEKEDAETKEVAKYTMYIKVNVCDNTATASSLDEFTKVNKNMPFDDADPILGKNATIKAFYNIDNVNGSRIFNLYDKEGKLLTTVDITSYGITNYEPLILQDRIYFTSSNAYNGFGETLYKAKCLEIEIKNGNTYFNDDFKYYFTGDVKTVFDFYHQVQCVFVGYQEIDKDGHLQSPKKIARMTKKLSFNKNCTYDDVLMNIDQGDVIKLDKKTYLVSESDLLLVKKDGIKNITVDTCQDLSFFDLENKIVYLGDSTTGKIFSVPFNKVETFCYEQIHDEKEGYDFVSGVLLNGKIINFVEDEDDYYLLKVGFGTDDKSYKIKDANFTYGLQYYCFITDDKAISVDGKELFTITGTTTFDIDVVESLYTGYDSTKILKVTHKPSSDSDEVIEFYRLDLIAKKNALQFGY